MGKQIHVPTEHETEEKRTETEIEEIEKSFFGLLIQHITEHLVSFLLYASLVGFGAWCAFFYIRTYAKEEEEENHG